MEPNPRTIYVLQENFFHIFVRIFYGNLKSLMALGGNYTSPSMLIYSNFMPTLMQTPWKLGIEIPAIEGKKFKILRLLTAG